jgi:hypothetical protein
LAVRCRELEREIGALAGLRACGEEWAAARGYAGKDPTRLVVDVRDAGYSGFEAAARLREDGVYPEMADFYRVVMIATPRNTCEDFDRRAASLRCLSRNGTGEAYAVDLTPPGTPERVCPAAEAFGRPARLMPLERAVGQVAAASSRRVSARNALLAAGKAHHRRCRGLAAPGTVAGRETVRRRS